MNKRHAKTTTTQRPQSIEFTLNTDVVKEISFTCLLYGGTIDWGDEEIEHRNNTISDLNTFLRTNTRVQWGLLRSKYLARRFVNFLSKM